MDSLRGDTHLARLTNEQTEFARSMTRKQRAVLQALSMYPAGYFLTASERADPELYALIYPYKFAQCGQAVLGGGLPSWAATDHGLHVVAKQAAGAL